jgi:hypothetical protein
MSTDTRTDMIADVARIVERVFPELLDGCVPTHVLKHAVTSALLDALPFIEKQEERLFMRGVIADAVDAALASRGRLC